jgi:hypothetical protein
MTLLIASIFPLVGLVTSLWWAPQTKHLGLD